jgi:hypothetical protein
MQPKNGRARVRVHISPGYEMLYLRTNERDELRLAGGLVDGMRRGVASRYLTRYRFVVL